MLLPWLQEEEGDTDSKEPTDAEKIIKENAEKSAQDVIK